MISSWRDFPPAPPRKQEPEPDPHIWDGVTQEQNASMTKNADGIKTIVTSIIDHMPAEQRSMLEDHQKSREASGQEAKVK